LFVPEYDPSELKIRIGKGKYSYAALALLKFKEIIVYPAYHYRYPEDYKSTLLHEVGHFSYCDDPDHGPGFKKYYDLLLERQEDIEEEVIPQTYNEFLYARPVRENRYEYLCSFCGEVLFRKKRVDLKCDECHLEMAERVIVS
jgi:hypothetical protein